MDSRASAVSKERTHGLNEPCSISLIVLFGLVGGIIDFDPPPCRRRNLGPPGWINVLLEGMFPVCDAGRLFQDDFGIPMFANINMNIRDGHLFCGDSVGF